MSTALYAGFDVSLNHFALVVLDEAGKRVSYEAMVSQPKHQALDKMNLYLGLTDNMAKKLRKENGPDFVVLLRHYVNAGVVSGAVSRLAKYARQQSADTVYVGIEDYVNHTTYAPLIGEAGGLVRLFLLMDDLFRIRLHDPKSIKLFATGKGDALKHHVVEAVENRFGYDYEPLGVSNVEPGSDLADAHVLARMVWTEIQVRSGRRTLQQLPDNERRIFLRVSDSEPVNLLERPLVCRSLLEEELRQ